MLECLRIIHTTDLCQRSSQVSFTRVQVTRNHFENAPHWEIRYILKSTFRGLML
jgi:hypothetical protein